MMSSMCVMGVVYCDGQLS